MKMLLHACCGPCSLEPSRVLREEGVDFAIFYTNSNIHPAEEYAHRLETLRTWADREDITVVEGAYEPERWEETAGQIGDKIVALQRENGLEGELIEAPNPYPLPERAAGTPEEEALRAQLADMRKARCRACYRLRFEEAAAFAKENGYESLCSTLSVSPFQYTDVIREELARAAEAAGIEASFRDWRPYFQNAEERSKQEGMYRQNYCGCRISDEEAQLERSLRKAARKARKKAFKAARKLEQLSIDMKEA